ncbi:MAG: type II secretion system protein GspE, partial [Deltaproteobacteria bacterium]|nr:type II secretion system protein GspE [Deltaproteobacteria bacterium]
MGSDNRIGELLVRENMISLTELRKAQELQKQSGDNLGKSLAKLGYVSDEEVTEFIATQYNVPSLNLDEYEIEQVIIDLIPKEVAERHKIIPVSRAGTSLVVAMSDPTNLHAIDDVKFLTGYNVEPVVSSESSIDRALERIYASPLASYDDVMDGFNDNEFDFGDEDGGDGDNVL